ncbi:MAG TPA: hypothetical protein VGD77_03170 [Gemmatimonadaceae bacterium]
MRTTFRAALTLAAALAAAPFAAASAQTTACYVPISGTIYVTGQPNSPSACLAGHASIVLGGGGGSGFTTAVSNDTTAFHLIQSGTGSTMVLDQTNTNGGSTTNGIPTLYVNNSSSTAAGRFSSTGVNGSALFATTTGGSGSTVSIVKNDAAATGVALRVNAYGTGQGMWVKNWLDAPTNGNAIYAENISGNATARIVNTGTQNGGAVTAESKGTSPTLRLVNVGTTGAAGYMESNHGGSTLFIKNLSTGTAGNAVQLESQTPWSTLGVTNTSAGGAAFFKSVNGSGSSTVTIRNENATSATGGALDVTTLGTSNTVSLRVTGNSNYTAADIRNNGTIGGALNLYSNNATGGSTLNITNDGGVALQVNSNATGDFGGMNVNSKGNYSTAGFVNTGAGQSIWAKSQGSGSTIYAENVGTTQGAVFGKSNSATSSTAGFENTGTGNALWAKSAGNTAYFESTATGNFIALSAVGSGTYPTAQFNHSTPTTGVALRVIGGMDVNQGMFYANAGATVNGNLQINGNYAATGTKTAIVPTSTGMRKMYTEEATEVWFTDYGFGKLEAGEVFVPLEGTFSETINTAQPYHVFLQSYGDAELVVTKRTAQGFVVKARNGEAGAEFSYRVVARRKGHEAERMQAQKQ